MVEAVIVSTARTPIGRAMRGAFNLTHGAEMGGHVIRHAVERAGIEPGEVEDVVHGLRQPRGRDRRQHRAPGRAPRRAAGGHGGDDGQPVLLSGLQAIAIAANRVVCDGVPVAVAGGLESISLVQTTLNRSHYRDEWLVEHKPGDLHADDRDGRHRRRALRHQPRGAGRIRAGEPAPHRGGAAGRAVRPGDRAAADDQSRARQGDQRDRARRR